MTAQVYVSGNFKGGVGKSTIAQMLAFESAFVKKRKTLVIDCDMQGDTSKVLALTRAIYKNEQEPIYFENTLYEVLVDDLNPENAIYEIMDNLDLLPADLALENYQEEVVKAYPEALDQINYFVNKLTPLKDVYDAIYLDVPPSISTIVKSAMCYADWAIIALQMQVKSLRNALEYVDYMEREIVGRYGHDLKIAGIVAFMLDKSDSIDQDMLSQAQETYGRHLLNNIVFKNGRLKRFDGTGITMEMNSGGRTMNYWDRRAHELFTSILEEIDVHRKWLRPDEE